MPVQQYRFQVRNARGDTVGGVLAAESVAGAAQVLRGRGDHILQLAHAAGGESAWKRLNESLSFSAGSAPIIADQ